MVIQNEMEIGAVGVKECLNDGRLEKVIREQRVVALQEKRLDAAVEELLKLEKEVRFAADLQRTQRVVMAIIQICYEAGAWKTLIRQVLFLSQRPDQLKQAVVAMIQLAVSYLKDIPDLDTRNELADTLHNVTSSKGLQSLCWHLLLAPHENLPGRSMLQIESLNLSGLDLPRGSHEERDQEPTQEQLLTPDFESRPSTPSPQQRVKFKDICPSICRASLKKKSHLLRKPMGPVRRRLFSRVSPADVEEVLSELEQSSQQRFIDRYNFDPEREKPLPGRFDWSPQRPQPTRDTKCRFQH